MSGGALNVSSGIRPSIDEWVERVSVEEMPIMYRTALDIAALAANEEAPASALVNAILKDPSLTARVLTMANSVFHNPGAQPLSTVSRALVVLGFNTVRSICLSVTLVDSVLQGHAREQLLSELARSFHAAVLARAMAVSQGDESPEEVFIATLLYRIGDLAFWCFGGSVRDLLEFELERSNLPEERIEADVLGFRLYELSSRLAVRWKLGGLLEAALNHHYCQNSRTRLVHLSYNYVSAASRGSEAAPELRRIEQDISNFLSLAPAAVTKLLEDCIREAADTARIAGAAPAANRITRLLVKEEPKGTCVKAVSTAFPDEPPFPQFDPLLQLKILRELTTLVTTTVDINEVLHTVLEGMYRSVGMDRAVFALVSPDRKRLTAKFTLGQEAQQLEEKFDFSLGDSEPNIFHAAIEKKTMVWAKAGNPAGSPGFVQRKIRELVGSGPFFIATAVMANRSIGLFYVDRRVTERPLDEESFQSFKLFAQQANLALDFLGRQCSQKDVL